MESTIIDEPNKSLFYCTSNKNQKKLQDIITTFSKICQILEDYTAKDKKLVRQKDLSLSLNCTFSP